MKLTALMAASIIVCQQNFPGAERPPDWAWRTIDGRPCWYQGRRMLPKQRLRWPVEPTSPDPSKLVIEAPDIMVPEPAFEHRWRGQGAKPGWDHKE